MILRLVRSTMACGALFLSGCSMVDDHLETRVIAANKGNNSGRNDGILLNIIRASDAQPLGFMALSKISGTQNTDFKLGLPTITIGKGITTAQKQAVFASNSWENSAQNSYDSAPLESGDFYKAMLSSVDLGTMQALIRQGYSRELVFSALIGSIRATTSSGDSYEFRNDPLLNEGTCSSVPDAYGDKATSFDKARMVYSPTQDPHKCEFRHFEFLLEGALKWGLNIEAYDPPKDTTKTDDGLSVAVAAGGASAQAKAPSSSGGSSGKDANATSKSYRFCFDTAYISNSTDLDTSDKDVEPYLCGATPTPGTKTDQLRVKFGSGAGAVDFTFDVRPRSGFGLFRYLGHVYRAKDLGPQLFWSESRVDYDDPTSMIEPLIRINQVTNIGEATCFAKVLYFGISYCVPLKNSTSTKQIFAMVAQLMALDTTASALPTTLDVRVQ